MVEYGSTPFLLFQIGEYANIVLMCCLIVILFFGGWHTGLPLGFIESWPDPVVSAFSFLVFAFKTVVAFFFVSIAKAIVPRYRYDQLMRLGWKVFLPTLARRRGGRGRLARVRTGGLDAHRTRPRLLLAPRLQHFRSLRDPRPGVGEAQARAADLRPRWSGAAPSMGGGVRQKDDSDGSRSGDWSCARERPKKK
jgi:hypothetical protein